MRHDEHRDVLRPVPVSVATSAVAAAASGAPSPASTSTLSTAALTLPAPAQSTVMSTSGQPPFATTTVAVATAAFRDVAVLASSCFALSATAVAVSASALPVSLSGAECVFTASAGGSECDTASSTTGRAECDGVSASSSARESVAADNAFRLVLDASPDGLPVLVWQRVPRCE